MKNRMGVLGFTTALLATAALALGQMGTGRVTGSVSDTEGNPIAGATVTASDGERALEATADDDGRWAILGFRSGSYEFTVTATGYAPQAYNQQVKQMGRNASMDFVLEPLKQGQGGGGGNEMLNAANSLFEQKQYAEAIAKYEELLAAEPTLYQIHYNIGSAYREMGELDKAVESFEKVLAEEPMNTSALVSIGDVYVAKGSLEEAVGFFEKAIDQTTDEIVPFNVAEIYFNQGNAAKALEYYQIASERKPDWPDPYLKLGYAYLNTGDIEAAKTSFQKVLEIAPGSQHAAQAEANLALLK